MARKTRKKKNGGTLVNMKGLTAKTKASKKAAMMTVYFGRPGVPTTIEATLKADSLPTIEDALKAADIELVRDKEGIVIKGSKIDSDGKIKQITDGIEKGVIYFIMPGVSSA